MRKLFILFFLVIALIVITPSVLAYKNSNEENMDPSYQEYLTYQEEGILEEDVTFEYWSEMVNKSKELEKNLENSTGN